MARGAPAYPGSARGPGCVGRPQALGTSGSHGWAHATGGKGRLNFLYSLSRVIVSSPSA